MVHRFPAIFSLLAITAAASAQTVIQNADGSWSSANSWRNFNNPMSAAIDGQLLKMQQQSTLFQNMLMQEMFNEQWRTIGRKIIAEKQATTDLAPLDAAMAIRIVGYRTDKDLSEADRRKLAEPLTADLKEAATIITGYGGNPQELGSLLATAMIMGYEHYTTARATPRQQEGLTNTLREGLLIDPYTQGQGPIGRELLAGKFASAMAALSRLQKAGDAAATQQAGGALLQSLWATPIRSLEPTETGFIDRGHRLVAAGKGTATFTPKRPLPDLAAEAVKTVYLNLPFDADESAHVKARQAWRDAWIADQTAFATRMKTLNLPDNDLAAIATAAVQLLWPALRDNQPVNPRATRQLFETFTSDIANDPSFQRMDDTERQNVATQWITRATQAHHRLQSATKAAELRAIKPDETDPMANLTRLSQISVLDADVTLGQSTATALLTNLFAPRKLDMVRQRPDGSFDIQPLKP